MGKTITPSFSQELVHLTLRGRRPQALVRDENDWKALTVIATRMLFWCGGSIHGCRCEGNEIHFAVQVAHASIGAMVRHLSDAYAIHLRRRHEWTRGVFKHYIAVSVDADLYLDDLVIWLHRPTESVTLPQSHARVCWTADAAYLVPNSWAWIDSKPVLDALGRAGAGLMAYRRRKAQPIAPEIVAILTRGSSRRKRSTSAEEYANHPAAKPAAPDRSNIELIARIVAAHSHVAYEDMRSTSRKRAVSKARILAAVLASRNGASVAAVARLFGRSRSTLIEQAEHYRETQPQLFVNGERALEAFFEKKRL
jgi:hypothetical protein